MGRVIANRIGLDEFVLRQVWVDFAVRWPDIEKTLGADFRDEVLDIGESHLTALEQARVAHVTPAEADRALDHIIKLIDRNDQDGPRSRFGVAYGLCWDLPGDAAWRFFQQMSQSGAHLHPSLRHDPDSYEPADLRRMLVAAKANRTGRTRNANLDHLVSRLASLWWRATGRRPTFSSYRRNEGHGPVRSDFGQFTDAFVKALGTTVSFTALATSVRRVVAGLPPTTGPIPATKTLWNHVELSSERSFIDEQQHANPQAVAPVGPAGDVDPRRGS